MNSSARLLTAALFVVVCSFYASCSPVTATSSSLTINSSSSVSVNINLGMKMKSYLGSASIGDIVNFSIDESNRQVVFSNVTRSYTWSSTYTTNSDGTASFTMPFNVPGTFVEIPGKAVALSIKILNVDRLVPAMAVPAPNVINGPADMTNVPGIYAQLMNNRSTNSDYSYGTYHINMGAVILSSTNWKYYEDKDHLTNLFSNIVNGVIYFSNTVNMPYSEGPGAYLPFVANGSTYVADLGYNSGFSFGLSCRTNAFTAADAAGRYVCMVLEQSRQSNMTDLSTNYAAPMYVYLSNSGTNLFAYTSPINGNYTNLADVLTINWMEGSMDGKMPWFYYMISTNLGVSGVIPTVILPSSDLQYGCLGSWAGSGNDTNKYYHVMMGFFKRIN